MKKILFTVLVVFTILFSSCLLEPKDKYEEYPFKGQSYSKSTGDGNMLTGTYLVVDGYYGGSGVIDYGEYYLVSFKSDNTCIVTFQEGPIYHYYDNAHYEGTYVNGTSIFTINFGAYSYTGAKYDLLNKTTSLKAGFEARKDSYNSLQFIKISDDIIDTNYWQKSRLNIFCGISNNFGETEGYRFLEDGTYYHYSTDGITYKGTYVIYQNTIKFSGDIMYGGYNFTVYGNYIAIGGSEYKII